MMKVEALVRPQRVDAVRFALDELGVGGMTITDARGTGKQKSYTQHYRAAEHTVNLLSKVRIETVVPDAEAECVVRVIQRVARTGEIGDGKIFVTPILDAIRIRTGERGENALR